MFVARTITNFIRRIDGDDFNLDIELTDKDGQIGHIPFIGYRGTHQYSRYMVNIGAIRKIEPMYNNIVAGTKIKSKTPNISFFPKKDINIIIGFLTDTGCEPLALCSNGCTLWANDLEPNFELIQKTSKLWKQREHVPMIGQDKLTYQNGDIISAPNGFPGYILCHERSYKTLRKVSSMDLHSNYPYPDQANQTRMKANDTRHGFITPRYTSPQINNFNRTAAYPNFHGGYNKLNVKILFKFDERALVNV